MAAHYRDVRRHAPVSGRPPCTRCPPCHRHKARLSLERVRLLPVLLVRVVQPLGAAVAKREGERHEAACRAHPRVPTSSKGRPSCRRWMCCRLVSKVRGLNSSGLTYSCVQPAASSGKGSGWHPGHKHRLRPGHTCRGDDAH